MEVTGLKGSLSHLSSLIRPLPQLRRRSVEIIALKASLSSGAFVVALFDGALFAVVVRLKSSLLVVR